MCASDDCHVEPAERGDVDESRLRAARRVQLAVSDMGCPNCAHRVRNALLGVPGVLDAVVHLPSGRAAVACEQGEVEDPALISAVENAGRGTRHEYRAEILPVA